MLEAHEGLVLRCVDRIDQPVAAQDVSDRAGGRDQLPLMPQRQQPRVDLASAPSRVPATQRACRLLHPHAGLARRSVRPTRAIRQRRTRHCLAGSVGGRQRRRLPRDVRSTYMPLVD